MEVRTFISFFLQLMLSVMSVCAQTDQEYVDSLKNMLSTAGNDSTKARMYIQLAMATRLDPAQSFEYLDSGLAVVKKMNWTRGYAIYYNDMGTNYNDRSIYDKALEYYQKSLDHSGDLPTVRILTLSNIAQLYAHQGNDSMARVYNEKVWPIARKENLRPQEGLYYTNASFIEKDTLKKQELLKKAIAVYAEVQDSLHLAVSYHNLGEVSGNHSDRLKYHQKALAIFDRVSPHYSVAVSNRIALAEEQLLFALNDRIRNSLNINESRAALLKKAERYIREAMEVAEATGSLQNLFYSYGVLSKIKKAKGEFEEALKYAEMNFAKTDSLFSQENKNRIAALESQREIDRRDKQLAVNELELDNARRTRLALIGGAVLLFVIGGLLLYQNVHRRRTNATLLALNNELDEANKIKTRFFGILSHDLRGPVANLIHFLRLQKEAPDLLDENGTKLRQQKLTDSAENLLETMETVLLWSKSQMDRFASQKKMVQLSTLFEYLKDNIPIDSIVTVSYENPDDISVSTDEDYLKTILYNLMVNALKALRNAPNPRVEWRAVKRGGKVLISITDNGPGVSREQVDALYNKKAAVGTKYGLGLHIIRDLAEAIQCSVVLDTGKNNGTTFTLAMT
ncbi:ATP-binding protein [Parapedobacter sp. 2B3]|uniref:ATP-binding protein n=1 Tax=Parapedobacter sp. 2B3 TaxID=3342381 RepID=UPI0035B65FA3